MSALAWSETPTDTELTKADTGEVIGHYCRDPRRNHPFFYCLRSWNYLAVVTNHAPFDHRWHHGLWWSWKFINDILYWEDHPSYGGNRMGLGHCRVEAHDVSPADEGVRINEQLSWRENETDRVVMSERRTMTVNPPALPLEEEWSIDWEMVWTAEENLTFETTPYPEVPWGGYGGLNYRPARSLAAREVIIAGTGEFGSAEPPTAEGAENIHGMPAAWAAYSGCLDGAETDDPGNPAQGGLAILEHPGNSGCPHPIYATTAATGFGFLASAPLMGGGMEMARGEQFDLRYRTMVLGHEARPEKVGAAFKAYAATRAAGEVK